MINAKNTISLLISGSIILLISCSTRTSNPNKDSISGDSDSIDLKIEPNILEKVYISKSGRKMVLYEDKSGGSSLSRIMIVTSGFSARNDTIDFGETDPILEVFQTDLNNDGFEELIIATQSAGSGSYGKLYGIGSNKDKSVSMIYFPEIGKSELAEGGLFDGYMGHDYYSVENNILVNTFPIYAKGDSNSSPTGGKARVYYSLVKGEASYILKAVRRD